jgi:hypothetical protein
LTVFIGFLILCFCAGLYWRGAALTRPRVLIIVASLVVCIAYLLLRAL